MQLETRRLSTFSVPETRSGWDIDRHEGEARRMTELEDDGIGVLEKRHSGRDHRVFCTLMNG